MWRHRKSAIPREGLAETLQYLLLAQADFDEVLSRWLDQGYYCMGARAHLEVKRD